MSWQTVSLGDVVPSPWRNGGGVTRELVAWPDGDNWIWRMSVAEVARSGPFSRFDGVQRWFVVLGGAGVRLNMPTGSHELTRSSAPFCFDGAAAVDCQLVDGPTQDFNLMVRTEHAVATMRRVSTSFSMVADVPKVVAVYAGGIGATLRHAGESMTLVPQSLAWQALPADATVQLDAPDALWMEIAL